VILANPTGDHLSDEQVKQHGIYPAPLLQYDGHQARASERIEIRQQTITANDCPRLPLEPNSIYALELLLVDGTNTSGI
jgi:hypothetical protein